MIEKHTLLFLLFLINICKSQLTLTATLPLHSAQITAIKASQDKTQIFIGSLDNKWTAFSMGGSILHQQTQASSVNDIGINPSTGEVIVLLADGNIKRYDPSTYALTATQVYPNSGYGNSIVFTSTGDFYLVAGFDGAGNAPSIHKYDSTSHVSPASSIPTTNFDVGSALKKILIFYDTFFFIFSDQSSGLFPIQCYDYASSTLVKTYFSSNAQVMDITISVDGSDFYSVAQDYSLRNYSISQFNNLYAEQQATYLGTGYGQLNAVDATMPGLAYVGTDNTILEYFRFNDFSMETKVSVNSPIKIFANFFTHLYCGTDDGKVLVYEITFFDGTDKDDTKWIILAAVLSSVIFLLMLGLVYEIRQNKLKEQAEENGDQVERLDNNMIHNAIHEESPVRKQKKEGRRKKKMKKINNIDQ